MTRPSRIWKTTDAGANWQHINKGMIDDSDVFSVIVDHDNPSIVFASACSGIYRSGNGADVWEKMQGIPYDARRTNVITQEEAQPAVEPAMLKGVAAVGVAGTGGVPVVLPGAARVRVVAVLRATSPVAGTTFPPLAPVTGVVLGVTMPVSGCVPCVPLTGPPPVLI